MERYEEKIDETVAKASEEAQGKLSAKIADFETKLSEKQKTSEDAFSAATSKLEDWKKSLEESFENAKNEFGGKLDEFNTKTLSQLENMRDNFSRDVSDSIVEIQERQDSITGEINDLDERVHAAVHEYEGKSVSILDRMEQLYQNMITDTQERVSAENDIVESKIGALNENLEKVSADSENMRQNLIKRLEADTSSLEERLGVVNSAIEGFERETQVFEKTDELKKQLEGQIAELQTQIDSALSYKELLDRLQAELGTLRKMDEDTSKKLAEFNAGRDRIDEMEKDFHTLVELSDTMDKKITELQTTSDELQNLQIQVRNFQDTLEEVSGQYERLEKKSDVLDRVMKDIDSSFDDLKSIEERLSSCQSISDTLPTEISGIQAQLSEIKAGDAKLNTAIEKMTSLQTILDETDKRIAIVTSGQNGVTKVEERLQKLSDEISERMSLLEHLARTEIDSKEGSEPRNEGITPQLKQRVRALKKQGWKNDEIAHSLKRSKTEIDLILEMLPAE